jgi:hypothetical protein
MTCQELIDFSLTFPAAYEDYPFDSIADAGAWTVMRHRTNKKKIVGADIRQGRRRQRLEIRTGYFLGITN